MSLPTRRQKRCCNLWTFHRHDMVICICKFVAVDDLPKIASITPL
jgi:hypothetical protein